MASEPLREVQSRVEVHVDRCYTLGMKEMLKAMRFG